MGITQKIVPEKKTILSEFFPYFHIQVSSQLSFEKKIRKTEVYPLGAFLDKAKKLEKQ